MISEIPEKLYIKNKTFSENQKMYLFIFICLKK